jgi:thymidine phosphorylase
MGIMITFKNVADSMAANGDEPSMAMLVEWVKTRSAADDDIAYLADKLASSGEVLAFPGLPQPADVASTGGPTSLSTLLCPLYLRELNATVPKLAVAGRPAGGIDVLYQIPGYKIQLTREEIYRILTECGYVHILADENYAPLDAALFAYRQRVGAQHVQPLVIASLLSKKLAMGLKSVGLDVRVAAHGNFGANWDEAKLNAQRFCRVAKLLDIEATCFLTDASVPYQPYIGRGESLVALAEVFAKTASRLLSEHAKMCFRMAAITVADNRRVQPDGGSLMHRFEQNLSAQGAQPDAFRRKVAETLEGHKQIIRSLSEGFLHISLEKLREVLVDAQKQAVTDKDSFPDPCGVILRKISGEPVKKGETIASVRAKDDLFPVLKERLVAAFGVTAGPIVLKRIEVIRNA